MEKHANQIRYRYHISERPAQTLIHITLEKDIIFYKFYYIFNKRLNFGIQTLKIFEGRMAPFTPPPLATPMLESKKNQNNFMQTLPLLELLAALTSSVSPWSAGTTPVALLTSLPM